MALMILVRDIKASYILKDEMLTVVDWNDILVGIMVHQYGFTNFMVV